MKRNNIIMLTSLWLKELLKRPLTWILVLIMICSFSSVASFKNITYIKLLYFLSMMSPIYLIIFNVISIDYIFSISFKDGLFYYLISTPLRTYEVIASKALSVILFSMAFFSPILIFLITQISQSVIDLKLIIVFINSIIFYILLTFFEFYAYFNYKRLSESLQRIIIIITVVIMLFLLIKTNGLEKDIYYLSHSYIYIFILNIILILFLSFKKTKRENIVR
jgi:hypothetical protein